MSAEEGWACCLACRTVVLAARTERGRVLPVDLAPAPAGQLAVPYGGAGVPVVRYLRGGGVPVRGAEWRGRAHNPAHWRRR